eukprot:TRINITY_DN4198_c0_g1_i4.p1 TRINITY_DN4198_c0_g1~~TRINITY_DN4198_c0_g1_i4.p1  ORF type:complete len:980 (+),score=279.12 TRINITY_DN4198_c0_g1_i4:212-3151(+)
MKLNVEIIILIFLQLILSSSSSIELKGEKELKGRGLSWKWKDLQWNSTEVNLWIEEMRCNNIKLSSIDSNWIPIQFKDNEMEEKRLEVKLNGISLDCSLEWNASFALIPSFQLNGKSRFSLSDSSFSQMQFTFQRNESGMLNRMELSSCQSEFNIENLHFEGGNFDLFLEYIRKPLGFAFKEISQIITCAEIDQAVENNITQAIELFQKQVSPHLSPNYPSSPPILSNPNLLANLSSSPLMGFIDYIPDDLVGVKLLKELVFHEMNQKTNAISLNNIGKWIGSFQFNLSNIGSIDIQWNSFDIGGLESISQFDISEPFDRMKASRKAFIYSNCTLDELQCESAQKTTLISIIQMDNLSFKTTFFVNISVNEQLVSSNVTISFNCSDIEFQSNLILALKEDIWKVIQLNQLESLNGIFSLIEELQITFLKLNLTLDDFQINTHGLGNGLDTTINQFVSLFRGRYLSQLIDNLMGSVVRHKMNSLLTDIRKDFMDDSVLNGEKKKGDSNIPWTIIAFASSGILFAIISIGSIGLSHNKNRSSSIKLEEYFTLLEDDSIKNYKNKWEDSIILSEGIHWCVRYGTLLLILFNIALFISAHSSIGATFRVMITIGEKNFLLPSSYDYTTLNNILNMWNAKIYYLSVIIAVVNGALPYVKSILLLLIWILPRHHVATKKILEILDQSGKWMFTDILVMILLAHVLHFRVEPPPSDRYPNGSIKLEGFLIPEWGAYCFLGATILSLLITHFVLLTQRQNQNDCESSSDTKISLHQYHQKPYFSAISVFFIISTTVLSTLGVFTSSFRYETKGLFGLFQTVIGEKTTKELDVFHFITGIPSKSIYSFGGDIVLQCVFWAILLLSFIFMIILCGIYFLPLTASAQKRGRVFMEIVGAWSSFEVFALVFVACSFAVQPFAEFLVGSHCDPYQPLLDQFFDGIKCYEIQSFFNKEASFLIIGASLSLLLSKILPPIFSRLVDLRNDENSL